MGIAEIFSLGRYGNDRNHGCHHGHGDYEGHSRHGGYASRSYSHHNSYDYGRHNGGGLLGILGDD